MRHGTLPATLVAAALLCAAFADLRAASDAKSDTKDKGKGLWTTNVAGALEQAAKEKKDVLMDFTGSDWCGWCVRLDKEVFSQDAFVKAAPAQFVLVKLDFPRKTQLPEALKAQNDEWLKKFGVKGYPSIVLTDAKGRPYARTGYMEGGPEAYLKHLAELRKAGAEFQASIQKALSAAGVEKATQLDAVLGPLDPDLVVSAYKELVDEIVKADPDNKAALRDKYLNYLCRGAQTEIDAMLRTRDDQGAPCTPDLDGALKKIEEAFKAFNPTGEQAQDLLYSKSLILFNKNDKAGAIALLEAAVAAAPRSRKAIQMANIIPRLKALARQEEGTQDAAKKGAEKAK